MAKPVKTRKSYSFVEDLMEAVFSFEAKKTDDREATDDEDNTIFSSQYSKKYCTHTKAK